MCQIGNMEGFVTMEITAFAPNPISTCGASSHAYTGGCSNGDPRSSGKPLTLFLIFLIFLLLTLIYL